MARLEAFKSGIAAPVGVWRGVIVCLLAALVASMAGLFAGWKLPTIISFTGVLCQLSGITCVALGLEDLRQMFGRRPIRSAISTWLKQVFGTPSRQTIKQLNSSSHAKAGMGASVRIWKNTSKSDSIENRLAAVEENLNQLDKDIKHNRAETSRNINEVRQRLDEESKIRSSENRKLKDVLEETSVGGLDLEATGLSALIFGAVFSGIPGLVASLLLQLY